MRGDVSLVIDVFMVDRIECRFETGSGIAGLLANEVIGLGYEIV